MNKSFERITTLEYQLKAANAQIKALLSGEKYVQMEQEFLRSLRAEERRRRELEEEVARSHSETITVRSQWFAVFEYLEKAHAREPEMLRRQIKQLINVRTILEVTEYHADVYYNSKTGERIHAEFPAGVVDDVNYGGSVKAFLLDNECCTSIDKSRKFLSDLTGGRLSLSKGMINKLSREFAQKTGWERNAMYFASRKKGHEGVKGTPVEDYQGILVHDHEKTFFHYGTDHQGCLAHVLRYLSHYRIPILYKRYINERFSIPLSSHASKRALSPPASIYFI